MAPSKRQPRPDMAEKWASVRADRLPPNPIGLCECGCGQATQIARSTDAGTGDVKGLPRRFLRGHNKRTAGLPYAIDPDTGCWVWLLARTRTGYGSMKLNGKTVKPHRVFYERYYGPLPAGAEVHHRCANRACCNPDHLEMVQRTENVQRSTAQKIDLTRKAELETILFSEPAQTLADRFGVSVWRIYQLRTQRRHQT